VRFRRQNTVLITSAAEPRQAEIRRREVRYILSMTFRTLCFILAVVALHGWVRFVAVLVALVLPWVAVVVANGGPPLARERPTRFDRRRRAQPPRPAELEPGRHVVVESEGWDSARSGSRPAPGAGVDGPPPDQSASGPARAGTGTT
jgi:hypothetical protein